MNQIKEIIYLKTKKRCFLKHQCNIENCERVYTVHFEDGTQRQESLVKCQPGYNRGMKDYMGMIQIVYFSFLCGPDTKLLHDELTHTLFEECANIPEGLFKQVREFININLANDAINGFVTLGDRLYPEGAKELTPKPYILYGRYESVFKGVTIDHNGRDGEGIGEPNKEVIEGSLTPVPFNVIKKEQNNNKYIEGIGPTGGYHE